MNKLFILLIFLNAFNSLYAQSFYDTTYHPNGKIQGFGTFDKERKIWIQKHFYFNGSIADIRQYDSSYFPYSESLTAFNIDGSIALRYKSFKGRPNGIFEEYYSNGILKQKGQFYNGFKIGQWLEYSPDGKLENERTFKLSSIDSTFDKEITFLNIDSFQTTSMKCQWGEPDLSSGERFQFININRFSFFLLIP